MNGISDLPQYLIGVIAVILVPGPNSLYCLSVAGQHGSRAAYRAIVGILLGDSLLILATVFGAGALLHRYPYLFHGIKIAGGLYLAWLGLNLLKGGWLAWQTRRNTAPVTQKVAPRRIFHHALTLSLMNPKAILFFLSFFTQFVRADAPNPLYSFLILALILPPLAPVLWFAYAAWCAALQYLDYPMANNGIPFREQRRRLRQQRGNSLAYGSGVSLMTTVPLLNLIAMPVGVIAATLYWVRYLRQEN